MSERLPSGGAETGPTRAVVAAPRRSRRDSSNLTRYVPVESAPDAMLADEIERARLFFRIISAVLGAMLIALPVLEGDRTAKWLFAGGGLSYLVALGWFVRAIREPSNYNLRNLAVVGVVGVLAATTGVYYAGVFSPAPALIVMALYMNSLVGNKLYTGLVYLTCASMQAALAALVMSGAVEDRGLIRPVDWSLQSQIITQVLVQGVYLATFAMARFSRGTTAGTVVELERAVRAVAQREALLSEARQELARAAWVGNPGRYTDQTLGSFELGVILGRGAMGEVYEARHRETGAPAAVKLLHRNVLQNPDHVARFAREVLAVANIHSPNVVEVLEVSPADAPMPYLAMERLAGEHLGQILQRRRRLRVREVVELVEQVGAGIDAATAAGVVHRDLKPPNLFSQERRGRAPVWKILDFGVSKLVDQSGTLTHGHAIGTPSYMSPEQARGKPVDHRTDVYALGAIAYRALTGHPAFSGADVPAILHDVVYRVPVRPGALVDVSEELDLVLAIALAKQVKDRFASGQELAAAMIAAARGELPEALRARGQRVVARYRWGKRIG